MTNPLKRIELKDEDIAHKIYLMRNKKVMLDSDLAALYNVLTGNLNKAVKRNIKRFPEVLCSSLTNRNFKT